MKKILFLIGVCLIVFSLVGCNMKSSQQVTEPSVEDVTESYTRAYEAYTWFELTSMPHESTMKEVDGRVYNKVNHESIKTYDDLENYLYSLFSKEIVEELLDSEFKRYGDIDGELYVVSGDRGTDKYKGEETFEVKQKNDLKFICIVEVELLGEDYSVIGYESHEFIYEFIDDQWVFTNFGLVR